VRSFQHPAHASMPCGPLGPPPSAIPDGFLGRERGTRRRRSSRCAGRSQARPGPGPDAGRVPAQVAPGRGTEGRPEHPGQVGLVGEGGLQGDGADRRAACAKSLSREVDAAQERVTIQAGPVVGPELPGQLIAAQPGEGLELGGAHHVVAARQLGADSLQRGQVEVCSSPPARSRGCRSSARRDHSPGGKSRRLPLAAPSPMLRTVVGHPSPKRLTTPPSYPAVCGYVSGVWPGAVLVYRRVDRRSDPASSVVAPPAQITWGPWSGSGRPRARRSDEQSWPWRRGICCTG
jgi:hypothetical protein